MSTSTYDKIHKMEDSVMKIQGLYTLWTMLYVTGLGCLAGDSTEGSSRNFLFAMTSLASIFPVFSGLNVIYGNKLPSTMFLTVGTVYQYFFWTLLAYYRGDIYGSHPIGVYNAVNTGFAGLFTVDMLIKTWMLTCNSEGYLAYVEDKKSKETRG